MIISNKQSDVEVEVNHNYVSKYPKPDEVIIIIFMVLIAVIIWDMLVDIYFLLQSNVVRRNTPVMGNVMI